MSNQEIGYDPNTPRTGHDQLTAIMFKDYFRTGQMVLNVASGNSHLGSDLHDAGTPAYVVSLDPMYGHHDFTRSNHDNLVAGIGQALPFSEETFDVTLCHFGVQHMPRQDVAKGVQEMIRVTKPAGKDPVRGHIIINPVFDPDTLQRELDSAGITQSIAAVSFENPKDYARLYRKAVKSSLVIRKNDLLQSGDAEENLMSVINTTDTLRTRQSLAERIARFRGGQSNA